MGGKDEEGIIDEASFSSHDGADGDGINYEELLDGDGRFETEKEKVDPDRHIYD